MISPATQSPAATHLIADLMGVSAARLRDPALLTGLLIAAAGGAGFVTVGAPLVRQLPDESVTGVLLLDSCHIAVHSLPTRGVLLLDVLSVGTHDARKALDVFVRRLAPSEVRSESRQRG